MSEKQPPNIVEGATTGDVEDEIPSSTAKSAEDRKAASALASLEGGDDAAGKQDVDAEAAKKALGSLGASDAPGGDKKTRELPVRNIKVDASDVALLVSIGDGEAWRPSFHMAAGREIERTGHIADW